MGRSDWPEMSLLSTVGFGGGAAGPAGIGVHCGGIITGEGDAFEPLGAFGDLGGPIWVTFTMVTAYRARWIE